MRIVWCFAISYFRLSRDSEITLLARTLLKRNYIRFRAKTILQSSLRVTADASVDVHVSLSTSALGFLSCVCLQRTPPIPSMQISHCTSTGAIVRYHSDDRCRKPRCHLPARVKASTGSHLSVSIAFHQHSDPCTCSCSCRSSLIDHNLQRHAVQPSFLGNGHAQPDSSYSGSRMLTDWHNYTAHTERWRTSLCHIHHWYLRSQRRAMHLHIP